MKYFRVRLIITFEEKYYSLLEKYISEIKCDNLSIYQDFARRHFVVDYNDDNLKFDINKSFFEQQPKKKVTYLILNMGESNILNEWLENVFKVLKYDEHKALFDLQYGNAVLSLCLDAETDSDLFDIGLSTNNLNLLSKINAKLDIDFYHYLT